MRSLVAGWMWGRCLQTGELATPCRGRCARVRLVVCMTVAWVRPGRFPVNWVNYVNVEDSSPDVCGV